MKYTLVFLTAFFAILLAQALQAQKTVFGPHIVDDGRTFYADSAWLLYC